MNHRVQKVVALMEEHLHRGWAARELAKFVNLSPSRLHQLFKEETGLPPARYLRLLRLSKASELLETSYLSVKEVMARVGLADESHFVRDFKKRYGSTPAAYREQSRAQAKRQSGVAPGRRASTPRAKTSNPERADDTPPILLRRASHPLQSYATGTQPPGAKDSAVSSLLSLRHRTFAEVTTEITAEIVKGMSGARPTVKRRKKSCGGRPLPPAASQPRLSPPAPPTSVTPLAQVSICDLAREEEQ